ncbi:MAG TPA: hypothetical protein VKY15_02465 [Acidimicrobiales bacterium]|nr:hypothetical protein [Acidimicrobiales bacterium]
MDEVTRRSRRAPAGTAEHLLNHALDAALDDHLARLGSLLDAGDEAGAADHFCDFRCVDLAMGSGHFLVAAVDRIEARLSTFLSLHPIPPVLAELERLRAAALAALGELADGVEVETTSLLRRQVARRCIYGVDRNRIAVELARRGPRGAGLRLGLPAGRRPLLRAAPAPPEGGPRGLASPRPSCVLLADEAGEPGDDWYRDDAFAKTGHHS